MLKVGIKFATIKEIAFPDNTADMEKIRKSNPKFLLRKTITLFVALFFAFGCAGTKPVQKPEQKPVPPVEEKAEQVKKEQTPSPQPTPQPPPKPASPPISEPPKKPTPSEPLPSPAPPLRTTKIVWDTVNLREGPGLNHKVIGNVKKGTTLPILEDKGNWLRVRLEDGKEAWINKSATSDAPRPPPPATPKPKPM